MSETPSIEAPPLLVLTRFGLGMKDPAWFEHRLKLIRAITAPSLASQTDQDFTWVVLTDHDLPAAIREPLEEIVRGVGDACMLHSPPKLRTTDFPEIARRLDLVRDGYVLTGRIDDDDAWVPTTVERIRNTSADWLARRPGAPGLGMTFERGFEWVMYEMLDMDQLRARGQRVTRAAAVRDFYFPFLGNSVFVLAQADRGVTAHSSGHSTMARYLEDSGLDVEVMCPNEPMWLYCRHKQTNSAVQKATTDTKSLSHEELAEMFGLDLEALVAYIGQSDEIDYMVEKRPFRRRQQLGRELAELDRRIAELADGDEERARLGEERAALNEELERLSRQVTEQIT